MLHYYKRVGDILNKIKKNSFIQGAFVATFGIVISKILGMIYVIPFHSMIGDTGGALYGYAYNIYSIFLSISTAGIPLAISSITSEYNTLEYYSVKEKVFKIARKYLSIVGIACFIILFIFARQIASLIMGDISGGNSIEDIALVIRAISFSILIVPTLSVYRGYLQGHKFITPTSISQVLEQIIRVSIIIVGSYLVVKVFNLPVKYAVVVALLGATIGSIFSLVYLIYKRKKYKDVIKTDLVHEEEKKFSEKKLLKQILICALPFIFSDLSKSLYNSVDTFFVVRTLVDLGYSVDTAETVMGVISTWGNKLNMIVVAIGTGFSVSLIPNLAASLVKNDKKDAEDKINLALSSITYLVFPMTLGLSFLSKPVWNIFYGSSVYGPLVFRVSIIVAIVTVLLTTSVIIAFSFKEYKVLYIACLVGLIFNACFDVPLMYLLENFGVGYYGAIVSTILGNLLTILIMLKVIQKRHNFSLTKAKKNIFYSLVFSLDMILCLYLLSFVININSTNRLYSVFIVAFYALVGGAIYFGLTYKLKVVDKIFGKEYVDKILGKVKRIFKKLLRKY